MAALQRILWPADSELHYPTQMDTERKQDVSAARSVAFDLLRAVLTKNTPLDDAIAVHDGLNKLPRRDRGFARSIVGVALRRLGQIDALIESFVEKPLPRQASAVRDILRLAVGELMFLDVAPHAAVDSAVTLVESRGHPKFKGLVNAVLRRTAKEGRERLADLPVELNYQSWMIESWQAAYGADTAHVIAESSLTAPTLDISVKADPEIWAEKLEASLLPTGSLRREFDGAVTGLPGFDEGAWWVQDAAAALPAKLLGDIRGKRIFDLCAAPGGKTLQLAAMGANVLAVDRSPKRLKRLERNLDRLDLRAGVAAADITGWTPPSQPDAILLDPPCTATGTIRRHPDILHAKGIGDLAKLTNLQFRLLARAAGMLGPGGRLVYCTCSMQSEEGESQVARALTELPLERDPVTADELGGLDRLLTADGDIRTGPHLYRELGGFDGFFIARFRKK
ncbi:RsmB/NOP family class I SAM-dependent RNA methyltransferase [Nisaea sp.]|uniref:RsmB/NOP family class I SAM-dependent RNA methyltransferase n=1 Tax=Nisaea sp. TaxID=2024842 RepID=UPI003B51A7EC